MADNDTIEETEEVDDEGSQDALGDTATGGMEHLDFISSIVLMLVCIAVIVTACGYYIKSRKAFYASPGFMPIIIAGSLFLLALSLMRQSLKKSSVKEHLNRLHEAIPRGLKSFRFKNSIIALLIFAVYIFVLMRFLPFWLASLILVFVCFTYLKAAKFIKSAVISILSVGGIVLLFQIIFHVPMP